jgi:hypothetical protein
MSSILNPVGLSHTFLEVFPLEMPIAIKKAAGLPTGIGRLAADLFTLEEHLNNAVDVLRNARTSYDYRHVMDEVKTALENIAAYPSKRELGKELLVQTSVISNVDSSAGGDAAAVEVITKFLQLLDSAYWIASKPAHVKLKGKSAPRFGMSPDRTDAVFVLTIGLAAFKFLIERIELNIKTVH